MKDLKFRKESTIFDGKWFYVSLAISLMIIGFTTWKVMNNTIDNVVDRNSNLIKNSISKNGYELVKDVNKNVKNVPITDYNEDSRVKNYENDTKVSDRKGSNIKKENAEKHSGALSKKEDENKPSGDKNTAPQQGNEKNLFIMPISGEIINNFSSRQLVKSTTLDDWRTHDGVDIKAKQGAPVKSIADGIIARVYDDPMWGRCVEINHFDNTTSYYCNLNRNTNVKDGDEVQVGQIIGSVGDTAICEIGLEPHLHIGVKENDVWIDPLSIMSKSS